MEFINSNERKQENKIKHQEVEELLSILANKGVITEDEAKKIKPNYKRK